MVAMRFEFKIGVCFDSILSYVAISSTIKIRIIISEYISGGIFNGHYLISKLFYATILG